jgi:uncharacterized protein
MKRINSHKKIVILGSYNSGKTTTLENICDKKVNVDYKSSTIALDYGNTIIEGKKVHVFGSPGQERFKFMREILSLGLSGSIVVIDSSKGLTSTDKDIITNLNSNNIPYVVFANKQDISSVELDHGGIIDAPIIATVAKEGKGVKYGLEVLMDLIEMREIGVKGDGMGIKEAEIGIEEIKSRKSGI